MSRISEKSLSCAAIGQYGSPSAACTPASNCIGFLSSVAAASEYRYHEKIRLNLARLCTCQCVCLAEPQPTGPKAETGPRYGPSRPRWLRLEVRMPVPVHPPPPPRWSWGGPAPVLQPEARAAGAGPARAIAHEDSYHDSVGKSVIASESSYGLAGHRPPRLAGQCGRRRVTAAAGFGGFWPRPLTSGAAAADDRDLQLSSARQCHSLAGCQLTRHLQYFL